LSGTSVLHSLFENDALDLVVRAKVCRSFFLSHEHLVLRKSAAVETSSGLA